MLDKTTDRCDTGSFLSAGLDETALALATAGFAALWNGLAERPEALVPGRGEGAVRAAEQLARRGRAELDDDGRLVGIHGLTLSASRHRFVSDGRARQTWCAFDAVGIPSALGREAVAHSDCPLCHEAVSVSVAGGVPRTTEAVLWLPSMGCSDLMAEFCSRADLYCSRDHVMKTIDVNAGTGQIVDLGEAQHLGLKVWADVANLNVAAGRPR